MVSQEFLVRQITAQPKGLISATRTLSQEVARRGVTVNAIAPGFIHTEMTCSLDESALCERIPVRRFGSSEKVAALTAFIASPEA